MKPKDLLEKMAKIENPGQMALLPGPLNINVNWHDGMAAKLLLWLADQLPENTKPGDLDQVLDSAKWWSTLLGSLEYEEIKPDEPEAQV